MAQIARELEFTSETLRQWIKQADIEDGLRPDCLTTEEHPKGTREARRLPREIKTLREERGILVRVAAFFAKQTEPIGDPSLRPGLAAHLSGLRESMPGGGRQSVDGIDPGEAHLAAAYAGITDLQRLAMKALRRRALARPR
jgi:transposase-like protein